MQQRCKKCLTEKGLDEFYRDKSYTSGYSSQCKACTSEAHAAWRASNPQYMHTYHQTHREEVLTRRRAKYAAERESINTQAREARRHNGDALRAKDLRHHHKHRRVRNAKRRARYYANHAHALAVAQRYAQSHKAQRRARQQANPHIHQAACARRRARKLAAAVNDFTAAQWQALKDHYGHKCVYCGRKMHNLTQDHIVPLMLGGWHTLSNIVPACQSCNSRKHTGPPLQPVQPVLLL